MADPVGHESLGIGLVHGDGDRRKPPSAQGHVRCTDHPRLCCRAPVRTFLTVFREPIGRVRLIDRGESAKTNTVPLAKLLDHPRKIMGESRFLPGSQIVLEPAFRSRYLPLTVMK